MQPVKKSILKVLAYFNVFNYPVTYEEIKFFLDQPFKEPVLQNELQSLAAAGAVFRMNGFYALTPDYTAVERRLEGNRNAVKKLKFATKLARFLFRFPYIKGVAVSGSLSKNFAYKGSDIDFFIITAPNRLWVARTFFLLFFYAVKCIGLNTWFCLNYYIDTTATEIPEKNIYTAIEIATLMPKQGNAVFADFYKNNQWVYNYLPNYKPVTEGVAERKSGMIKRFFEWMLNNKTGDALDSFLCRFYRARWRKMFDKKMFAKNGFQFGSYIAGNHVCKPMPHYFQNKVLTQLESTLQSFEIITQPQQVAV